MAILERTRDARRRALPADCLVGRRDGCAVELDHPTGSSVHADLRYRCGRWTVRDLSSTNGTFVDGVRIAGVVQLEAGQTLSFGEARWVLVDAGPPCPFATSLDDLDLQVIGTAGTLGLPDADRLLISILDLPGGWWAEDGLSEWPVEDGEVVVAGGRWRLCLPSPGRPPPTAREVRPHLTETVLVLEASADFEHIDAVLVHRTGQERLEHRAHHELLLVLALARLDDADHPNPRERGWVAFDDLARRLSLDPGQVTDENRLRSWIHRLRRQFDRLGVREGRRIVERRTGSRSVRLGVDDVAIRT